MASKRKIVISSAAAFVTVAMVGTIIGTAFMIPTNNTPFSGVGFMANTSQLHDGGFNEQTLAGVYDYEDEFGERVYVYEPSGQTSGAYTETMWDMYHDGVTTYLSNGFLPTWDTGVFPGWAAEHPDFKFIIIDDDGLNGFNNGISIQFDASDAGFFAGVAAGFYASYAYVQAGDTSGTAEVTTWGGEPFANVYDWLSGFEQGINWFNYAVLGTPLYEGDTVTQVDSFNSLVNEADSNGIVSSGTNSLNLSAQYAELPEEVQIISMHSGGTFVLDSTDIATDANEVIDLWYTMNFFPIPDSTNIKATEAAGASVFFPVAGPQTTDAVNYTVESDTMIIGVDVPAENLYSNPAQQEKILGSATKNLQDSTSFAIWYTERYTAPVEEGGFAENPEYVMNPDGTPNEEYGATQADVDKFNQFIDTTNTSTESNVLDYGETEDDPSEYDGWISGTWTDGSGDDPFAADYGTENDDYKGNGSDDGAVSGDVWNEEEDMDYTYFKGNYKNGGVDFVVNEYNDALEVSVDYFASLTGDTLDWADIMVISHDAQNGVVEKASRNFAIVDPEYDGTYVIDTNQRTDYDSVLFPWIPDWDGGTL